MLRILAEIPHSSPGSACRSRCCCTMQARQARGVAAPGSASRSFVGPPAVLPPLPRPSRALPAPCVRRIALRPRTVGTAGARIPSARRGRTRTWSYARGRSSAGAARRAPKPPVPPPPRHAADAPPVTSPPSSPTPTTDTPTPTRHPHRCMTLGPTAAPAPPPAREPASSPSARSHRRLGPRRRSCHRLHPSSFRPPRRSRRGRATAGATRTTITLVRRATTSEPVVRRGRSTAMPPTRIELVHAV